MLMISQLIDPDQHSDLLVGHISYQAPEGKRVIVIKLADYSHQPE